MINIDAYYFDGKTASRRTVAVLFHESGMIEIEGDDLNIKTSLDSARISPRIGNTARSIYLADGAKLESFANDELDTVGHYFRQNRLQAFVHKLEKRLHYVIAAFFITVFSIWAGVEYGVPLAAKWAAKSIPFSVEQQMGTQGLETLEKLFFSPSRLDDATQQRLSEYFRRTVAPLKNAQAYQLHFRHGGELGANALALPGGIIIVTDGLVELADNDEQIIAVLGHELAHIIYQHGLRSVFQNSLTALLMAGLLGDISSISSVAVALPTILVEMRYSRQFEQEADEYAVNFLENNGIDPEAFAQILAHLQKTMPEDAEFNYLSSHPAMNERIERVRQ